MRVLMVITGLDVGGAETSIRAMAQAMVDLRHTVKVISLTTEGPIGAGMIEDGLDVEAIGMSGISCMPWAVWQLSRIVRAWRPDVIHSWMYHANLVAGLAGRMAGMKNVVWSLHASNISRGMLKESTRALNWVLARLSSVLPARIIATSRAAADAHGAVGYDMGRMMVLPNGVDAARFAPDSDAAASLCAELGLAEGTRLVGLIARYDVQKNHSGFFEAAAVVRAHHWDAHFVLAGIDISPEHPVLAKAITRHRLWETVSLMGPRQDILRIAAALDVVVMSSDGESFPLTLIEAMACGAVPAVTDVGAMAYIVGETGRVSPVGEMAALGANISELLAASPAEHATAREAARQRVLDNFTIQAVAEAYLEAYCMR